MNQLVRSQTIYTHQTILDAVECIESGALQIVFVVDDERRLAGVLTNGDLRRTCCKAARRPCRSLSA